MAENVNDLGNYAKQQNVLFFFGSLVYDIRVITWQVMVPVTLEFVCYTVQSQFRPQNH